MITIEHVTKSINEYEKEKERLIRKQSSIFWFGAFIGFVCGILVLAFIIHYC